MDWLETGWTTRKSGVSIYPIVLQSRYAATRAATAGQRRFYSQSEYSMRVLAQENRDMRMAEAEKKAAALPPKLTVPMILFFLPVLFIVILGPAAICVMALQ